MVSTKGLFMFAGMAVICLCNIIIGIWVTMKYRKIKAKQRNTIRNANAFIADDQPSAFVVEVDNEHEEGHDFEEDSESLIADMTTLDFKTDEQSAKKSMTENDEDDDDDIIQGM